MEHIISGKVSTWFDQNPSIAKVVLEKITQAAMARDVARKARDMLEGKVFFELSGLPGKLADCQIQKEGTELFIVERLSWWFCEARKNKRISSCITTMGKILNTFVNGKSNGEDQSPKHYQK